MIQCCPSRSVSKPFSPHNILLGDADVLDLSNTILLRVLHIPFRSKKTWSPIPNSLKEKRKEIESSQLCTQLLLAIIRDALLGWTLLCSFFLSSPCPRSRDAEHVRGLKMHRTEFPCLSTNSSGPQEVLPFPDASKSNRALHELVGTLQKRGKKNPRLLGLKKVHASRDHFY